MLGQPTRSTSSGDPKSGGQALTVVRVEVGWLRDCRTSTVASLVSGVERMRVKARVDNQ